LLKSVHRFCGGAIHRSLACANAQTC
jgi:hypothetical protein